MERKYKFIIIFLILILFNGFAADYNLPIILDAYSHVGNHYSYAAIGPNSFDCSGFIYYLFLNNYQIKLPHSAYKIGYDDNYLKIENKEDLCPGDVVCFNTNRSDNDASDHVGLYIDNGIFIHASSGKGKVIISSLLEGFYSERFSWGRRIIPQGDDSNEYND